MALVLEGLSGHHAAAAPKLFQSCLALCFPIDGSPPGSSVPGIFQARILEWVAISFSKACMHAKLLQSCPTLCNPMDSAHQAPVSTGFSRQEYWSGLPFPSPRHACMLRHCSRVRLCVTLWTAAHQAPLSTGFSRQEYWSGLPFPSPSPWTLPQRISRAEALVLDF